MDDEKYMLRKSTNRHPVKLDPDIFYQILEHSIAVKFGRGVPRTVDFWKRGVRWSVEMPANLARFIMKAKKGKSSTT